MRKMRFSSQASGTIRQVVLTAALALVLAACGPINLPDSSTWFVREGDGFRRLGGFSDLPSGQWLSWEEGSAPQDCVFAGGDAFLLINRLGAGKLSWQNRAPVLEQLASFRSLGDMVLHRLWTWDKKFVMAARPVEPRMLSLEPEKFPSLLFWTPESPIFTPLPVGVQTRDPLLQSLFVRESDGHWDMVWEKPSSEIQYSRYFPDSGTEKEDGLSPSEFWREADPDSWELLPEDWKNLTLEQVGMQGDTLLRIHGQKASSVVEYLYSSPGLGTRELFALSHPQGMGILSRDGKLTLQRPGLPKESRQMPVIPHVIYPYFTFTSGGILVVWMQGKEKYRNQWGVGWIPLDSGI